jgi:predicted deacylase
LKKDGGSEEVNVQKQRLAEGRSYETFYYVIKGKRQGPVCMITAGIHGTEKAGVLAAQKLRNIRLNLLFER